MYDSIDIKYIDLPDVHKLENHEDYVTFSHADMLSKEGIFYDSSRDTELRPLCPMCQKDSDTLTGSPQVLSLRKEEGCTCMIRLVCILWGG